MSNESMANSITNIPSAIAELLAINKQLQEENARLRELVIEAYPDMLKNDDWIEKMNKALERGE